MRLATFGPLLRNRQFLLLWLGQAISNLGDAVFRIALLILVTEISSSPLALTLVLVAQAIPSILIGPVAGVFVDRWDRRQVMLVTDVLRACAVLLFFFSNGTATLVAVAALLSTLSSFFTPARMSLVPEVVGKEHFLAASSLTESTMYVVSLAGPALGGILVGLLGTGVAFWFDSATFLASALCLFLLGPVRRISSPRESNSSFRTELIAGMKAILDSQVLVFVIGAFSLVLVVFGGLNVLLVDYVRNGLQASPRQFGAVESCMFAGVLISTLLVGAYGQKMRKGALIFGSLAVMGSVTMVFFFRPELFAVYVWAFLLGAADGPTSLPFHLLLVEETTQEIRGRVMSVYSSAVRVSSILGMSLAGLLAARFGSHFVLAAGGALLALISLLARLHPVYERLNGSRQEQNQAQVAN